MRDQGEKGTTRRGFMATIGAVGAAGALPLFPTLAAQVGPGRWPEAVAEWPRAYDALRESFRPAYFAELERLAEKLRPRFESGELRGLRDLDVEEDVNAVDRVEAACAEHFGLHVEETDAAYLGDEGVANLIIDVSPSAQYWDPGNGWNHPAHCAKACAAWDVIAVATARGYYAPTPEECPKPEHTRWATGVRS